MKPSTIEICYRHVRKYVQRWGRNLFLMSLAIVPTFSHAYQEEDIPKVPTPFEVFMGIAGAVNEGRRRGDEITSQWAREREEEGRRIAEQQRSRESNATAEMWASPPAARSNYDRPTEARFDGVNASACLRVVYQGSQPFMENNCNVKVWYSYCVINGDQLMGCGPSSSAGYGIMAYGRGAAAVDAGRRSVMAGPRPPSQFAFFGCSAGPSGRPPLAFLTSYNPPQGVCH